MQDAIDAGFADAAIRAPFAVAQYICEPFGDDKALIRVAAIRLVSATVCIKVAIDGTHPE